ncbi:MAG: formamidopyrimidine-DNA glycosylase [Armatimonadetes bacterium]|nr:formamidopyrimidine-DNA glycosylase [Armatimonadota bacterium]
MPELPDIELYRHAFQARLVGRQLLRARVGSPFLLRSHTPPPAAAEGRAVVGVERLGKRIVWVLEGELLLVFHLMIAGRWRWQPRAPKSLGGKVLLAAFEFANGCAALHEAATRKRASLHVVQGRAALAALDPGGLEVLEADIDAFEQRLRRENHTLKRALTDPRLISGIGNAYSDEILWHAGLSPLQLTAHLDAGEVARLYEAVVSVLSEAAARLVEEAGDRFPRPEEVTAFRPEFGVHGKFGQPCPRCGGPVERIRYAENETDYCPGCQTDGRVLADRSLSTLLRDDWPRTVEEMEELRGRFGK